MSKTTLFYSGSRDDMAYPLIPLVKYRFLISLYTQAGNGRLFPIR